MDDLGNVSRILFISHVNPSSCSAGNEIRIHRMIKWLRAEGIEVALLLNHPPLSNEMRKLVLENVDAVYTADEFPAPISKKIIASVSRLLFRPPGATTESEKMRTYLCPPYLIEASRVLCKKYRPQAVIAEYVFTTPCLRKIPSSVLKLVDTHDLLSKRDPEEAIYCSAEEERAYLLNADVVIAIQNSEAEQFRILVPERRVVTVGLDFEVLNQGEVGGVDKNSLLFVGSRHPGNISGFKAFLENAWPLICDKRPQAELLVAGKISNELSMNVPRVRVLGWVDNLQSLYRKSTIVINPTMYGTGLQIKTVEALANGKALVATPKAVEGLDFREEAPCVVGHNWPEFAGVIISLLESDERRLALQEAARRFAKEQFSSSKVYAQLADIFRR